MNLISLDSIKLLSHDSRIKSRTNDEKRFPPSLYYQFLRLLIEAIEPDIVVELGVCGGGASYHMSRASWMCRVFGVDISNDYPDNIDFIYLACPNYKFVQMDSIDAAMEFDDSSVGLLFIDTIHTYDRTLAEFNAWLPKMKDGGVVVLDDLFRAGMKQAWDELPGNKIRLDHLHIGGSPTDGGFGVVIV